MTYILVWGVVIAFLIVCLLLWFYKVRKTMQERQHTVEVAAEQLAFYRKKTIKTQNDLALADVLTRSESIYKQSVELYRIALENPFNWLPAKLMGFRPFVEGDNSFQR